jgi:hypothetical protein
VKFKKYLIILPVLWLLYLLNVLYWEDSTVDDAFISYRYSENLARGEGLTYNPGERVEGYSNFLWVLLHVLPSRLGLELIPVSRWLSIIAGMILLAVVILSLRNNAGSPTLCGIMAGIYLSLNPFIGMWTMAGLETVWYSMLLTTGIFLLLEGKSLGWYLWSAILLGLACLTRPEGIFIVASLGLSQILIAFSDRMVSRRQIAWGSVLVGLLGLFYIWRYLYYGELVPNTYYAKIGSQVSGLWREAGYIYVRQFFLTSGWSFGLFILVGTSLSLRLHFRKALGWLLPSLAGLYFGYHANGDWMPNFRLLVPIIPVLVILATRGFIYWREKLIRPGRLYSFRGLIPPFLAGGLLCLSLFRIYPLESVQVSLISGVKKKSSLLAYIGDRKNTGYNIYRGAPEPALYHVRPGETIFLGDIGVVGYITNCTIVDANGLVDKKIPLFLGKDKNSDGFLSYFFQKDPEIVYLLTRTVDNLPEAVGWSSRTILNSELFKKRWKKVGRHPAFGDRYYCVFRRTDTKPLTREEVKRNLEVAIIKLPGVPWLRTLRAGFLSKE